MYKFLDAWGMPITLTFDEKIYSQRPAGHVLVFPFYQGKLVFTLHTKRGIELPGGKVEPGEDSATAASRETYEETGCTLSYLEKIGQYTVGEDIIKDIFVAEVEKQVEEMKYGSVGGMVIFETIPEPEAIKGNPQFSSFLYDDVYPLTLAFLRDRPSVMSDGAKD